MNRSLKNLLRSLVGDNPKRWEFIIPQVEFAYNSSFNRWTKKAPFDVIYGRKPHQVLDIFPLNNQFRVSMDAEEFAAHIKGIHDQVREHLKEFSKHIEGVQSLKKVISSWFLFGRKDFQLVLITSSSKGSLDHAESSRNLDQMQIESGVATRILYQSSF